MKEPRMSLRSKLFATIAIAALAVPASALAASGSYTEPPGNSHGHGHHNGHGKSQKKNPVVTYVFKGTYDGAGSVAVLHGNSFVKKQGFVGQDVSFDLSAAKVVVADSNADGTADANDVAAGDKVVVKSRLHKKDPGVQPFQARQLVDQTHPAPVAP
jgi:hypothetical protein